MNSWVRARAGLLSSHCATLRHLIPSVRSVLKLTVKRPLDLSKGLIFRDCYTLTIQIVFLRNCFMLCLEVCIPP